MKSIALLFICLITFNFFACKPLHNKRNQPGVYHSKGEVLKDYALCQCIRYGFEKDSIILNDVSISVLFELSDYSISLHEKKYIDSLSKSYAWSIKPSQVGDYGNKKAILLRCINFYKSKQLKKHIDQLHK